MSWNLENPLGRYGGRVAEHMGALGCVAALERGFIGFNHAYGLDVREWPTWALATLIAGAFITGALAHCAIGLLA